MASCLNWLDLSRRVERMLASSSSETSSLAYTEGDIEDMVSAAELEGVSTAVRDLYRDFVEMCVHLRTSVSWVYVGYQWSGEDNFALHDRPHPDHGQNVGTVLYGDVDRIGNDGAFKFFVGNFGRSYPHVVVTTTLYRASYCVHVREYDPTLAIYDLRSVLSLTEASRTVPDMQKAPQSLPSVPEVTPNYNSRDIEEVD